jgi:hypothetical protein
MSAKHLLLRTKEKVLHGVSQLADRGHDHRDAPHPRPGLGGTRRRRRCPSSALDAGTSAVPVSCRGHPRLEEVSERRRFLLVVIALGLAGCGSDKLNAAFGGLWTGPVTLTMGSFTSTETVQITITLPTETTLTISPVCPGNAGSITASGSGNSASWSGSQVCPAFAIAARAH